MKAESQKDYLSPKEIALSLNISYFAALVMVRENIIKAEKVNCRWHIKPNDFAAFKAKNKRAIEKLEQKYIDLYWQGLNPDQLEKRVAEDFKSKNIVADRYGFATNAIYKSLLPKHKGGNTMIDIEAIKARAEAATPIVLVGAPISQNNALFLGHAKGDVLALIAEVERLTAFCDEWCKGEDRFQEVSEELDCARSAIKRLQSELDRVTKERDAAVEDLNSLGRFEKERCAYCIHDNDCEPGEMLCSYEGDRAFEYRGVERSGENG